MLMDAFDAAVLEAAGWLPKIRVAATSLVVPVPDVTYKVTSRTRRMNTTKSAWPNVCVRCGTPTGWPTCGWPLGATILRANGCLIGVRATLPATRHWIRVLAPLIPEATLVESAVLDLDGRAENARIRAAKPWRRPARLKYACLQCEQASKNARTWRAILAAARRDGSVFLYGRMLSASEAEREYGFVERDPWTRFR
jgi:hypothetical protein